MSRRPATVASALQPRDPDRLMTPTTGTAVARAPRRGTTARPQETPSFTGRQAWLEEGVTAGRLTPKGHDVARFIASNPGMSSLESASEVARAVGVNVATVVRFAQGLGFSGWVDFQINLRHRYL